MEVLLRPLVEERGFPEVVALEKPREEWMPDEASPCCCFCQLEFSFFRRRHHCRSCGKLFCDSCSSAQIALGNSTNVADGQHGQERVRVCSVCYKQQQSYAMGRMGLLEDVRARLGPILHQYITQETLGGCCQAASGDDYSATSSSIVSPLSGLSLDDDSGNGGGGGERHRNNNNNNGALHPTLPPAKGSKPPNLHSANTSIHIHHPEESSSSIQSQWVSRVAIMQMECSVEQLRAIWRWSDMPYWMPKVVRECKVVDAVGDRCVVYARCSFSRLVRARDLVFVSRRIETKNSFLMVQASLPKLLNKAAGTLRIEINSILFACAGKDGKGSIVTAIAEGDPGGVVPGFAVNRAVDSLLKKSMAHFRAMVYTRLTIPIPSRERSRDSDESKSSQGHSRHNHHHHRANRHETGDFVVRDEFLEEKKKNSSNNNKKHAEKRKEKNGGDKTPSSGKTPTTATASTTIMVDRGNARSAAKKNEENGDDGSSTSSSYSSYSTSEGRSSSKASSSHKGPRRGKRETAAAAGAGAEQQQQEPSSVSKTSFSYSSSSSATSSVSGAGNDDDDDDDDSFLSCQSDFEEEAESDHLEDLGSPSPSPYPDQDEDEADLSSSFGRSKVPVDMTVCHVTLDEKLLNRVSDAKLQEKLRNVVSLFNEDKVFVAAKILQEIEDAQRQHLRPDVQSVIQSEPFQQMTAKISRLSSLLLILNDNSSWRVVKESGPPPTASQTTSNRGAGAAAAAEAAAMTSMLKGTRVFHRAEEGSRLHSFKLEAVLHAPIMNTMLLLQEISLYSSWLAFLTRSLELLRGSRSTRVALAEVAVPWPLANRDMCLNSTAVDASDEGFFFVHLESVPENLTKPEWNAPSGICRIDVKFGAVKMVPLSPNDLHITAVVNIDPKINAPAHLVNWIATQILYWGCVFLERRATALQTASRSVDLHWKKFAQDRELYGWLEERFAACLESRKKMHQSSPSSTTATTTTAEK